MEGIGLGLTAIRICPKPEQASRTRSHCGRHLTARDGTSDAFSFALGAITRTADALGSTTLRPSALLHDVRQLVGQQGVPSCRTRRVLSRTKNDISPNCVGQRIYRPRRLGRPRIRMKRTLLKS